eukprot:6299389-Prymnesium_polylepis.1
MFGEQQMCALADYIRAALMLKYNERMVVHGGSMVGWVAVRHASDPVASSQHARSPVVSYASRRRVCRVGRCAPPVTPLNVLHGGSQVSRSYFGS